MAKTLSTDPYKGTRDFYPEDMAIQRYIFDTWAHTAELFGFERYDASILEPSELYKSKGAENEELINEQTYTFTDRGDREVTLRPEMTPTVARMVAARRRELSFPVRWYSIPNLFRYERPQRGRLREHWQLNCDMFGVDAVSADVEMIALAYRTLIAFGATPEMFEIRINSRAWLDTVMNTNGFTDTEKRDMLLLLDKKEKMPDFEKEAEKLVGEKYAACMNIGMGSDIERIIDGLKALGIPKETVRFSPSTVRGFNYYTGVVFEIFDTSKENPRALMGGGRYDNLTTLFGGDPISGIGFGVGDVTMRDFLETHNLIPAHIRVTAPTLAILPVEEAFGLESEKIAHAFRNTDIRTSVDLSTKKIGKKISTASDVGVQYIIAIGEEELKTGVYTLKELATKNETSGTLAELIRKITE